MEPKLPHLYQKLNLSNSEKTEMLLYGITTNSDVTKTSAFGLIRMIKKIFLVGVWEGTPCNTVQDLARS